MNTTMVEFVHIDDNPFVQRVRYTTGVGVPTIEVSDDYAELAAPFRDALDELWKQQDDAVCGRCNEPVGLVLRELPSGVERLFWTATGLAREVREGEHTPVVALCEPCTPLVPQPEDGAQ